MGVAAAVIETNSASSNVTSASPPCFCRLRHPPCENAGSLREGEVMSVGGAELVPGPRMTSLSLAVAAPSPTFLFDDQSDFYKYSSKKHPGTLRLCDLTSEEPRASFAKCRGQTGSHDLRDRALPPLTGPPSPLPFTEAVTAAEKMTYELEVTAIQEGLRPHWLLRTPRGTLDVVPSVSFQDSDSL